MDVEFIEVNDWKKNSKLTKNYLSDLMLILDTSFLNDLVNLRILELSSELNVLAPISIIVEITSSIGLETKL